MVNKKNKVRGIKRELDRLLGDENTQLLEEVVEVLGDNTAQTGEIKQAIETLTQVTRELNQLQPAIEQLQKIVGDIRLEIPPELRVVVDNIEDTPQKDEVRVKNLEDIPLVKSVRVDNLDDIKQADQVKVSNLDEINIPEQKDEVSVKNLDEIEIPSEVGIKKPGWWRDPVTKKEFSKALMEFATVIKKIGIKQDLDEYRDAKRPLAVRLSNGRKFIDVLTQVVSQGGGGTAFPFETSDGIAKAAVVTANGSIRIVGALPTDGNNPSLTLSYTSGNLTQIDKVIDGVTYRKTLSYTGDDLTSVSAWVQQ